MTDTPDIEALVAEALNHEKAILGHSWCHEGSVLYYAAERIHRLAAALEAQQAVVEGLAKTLRGIEEVCSYHGQSQTTVQEVRRIAHEALAVLDARLLERC